jgi:hypothetical protein
MSESYLLSQKMRVYVMGIQLSSRLLRDASLVGKTHPRARERRRQLRFSDKDGGSQHAREVRDTLVRAALAVLFAVLSATALFYAVVQAADSYSLAKHFQSVQGHITQTQCASHLQVAYAFDANGITYHSNGIAHRQCNAYRIGEPVAVYFAPDNPSHSLSEVTPVQQWHTQLALLLAEVGVLATLALILTLRRKD